MLKTLQVLFIYHTAQFTRHSGHGGASTGVLDSQGTALAVNNADFEQLTTQNGHQ